LKEKFVEYHDVKILKLHLTCRITEMIKWTDKFNNLDLQQIE